MGIWDKIKQYSDDLNDLNETSDTTLAGTEKTETLSSTPSTAVKKALSMGASAFIKSSKKVINSIVSRYHPTISHEIITDVNDINKIIHGYEKNKNWDKIILVEVASNSLATIHVSKTILLEMERNLTEGISWLETNLKKNPDSKFNKSEVKNLKDQLKELLNSETYLKIQAIGLIKGNEPDRGQKLKKISAKLNKLYPDWKHPLLAKFLLLLYKTNLNHPQAQQYLEKALFCDPLNEKYLQVALKICPADEHFVYEQLFEFVGSK